MTIVVSLLYAAEVALGGYWRPIAILAALVLLLQLPTDPARVRLSHWLAVIVLSIGALQTGSPILAVTAALVVVPRRATHAAAWLTLVALGIHVLWWRYLGAMPVDRIPESVAAGMSWFGGSSFHVTPTGIATRGHFIRFSAVPIAAVTIPLFIALIQLNAPRTALSRFTGCFVAALLLSYGVVVTLTLFGHVHFLATAGWLLVPIGIGTISASVVTPPSKYPDGLWGVWVAAVVALTLLWLAGPRPQSRTLRLAFDEAHGKWETIEAPFGTSKYGRDTVYNYALLARWLQTKHTVMPLRERWTSIDADALVVKMPTAFYGRAEKAAIDSFVRNGGLLLVLGDHTNLYGTAFIINDLLVPYGLEIEATATVPLAGDHYDYRPAWWQRTRYLRGVHSIQFQTAGTIKTRHPLALPLLVGDRVVGEDADYSNERFFGDLHPGPEDRHPPIVMAAERRVGRGRIILFTDSTIFSSFSMMAPGNRELFQNFVEYGTTYRSPPHLIAVGFVLILCIACARRYRLTLGLAAAPVILAFATSPGAPNAVMEMYPADWVDFDMRHSHVELRFDPLGTHGPGLDDFSTFFAWCGRTGAMPRGSTQPYKDPTVPTVLINPDKPFQAQELEEIEQYVRRGGRLLLFDDPQFAARTTASAVMHRFGMSSRVIGAPAGIHDLGPPPLSTNLLAVPFDLLRPDRHGVGGRRARVSEPQLVVEGTVPLLVNDRGFTIASRRAVGAGAVVVVQNSTMFSDFGLGDVWGGQELDPERERLYRLAYDVISLIRHQESR